MQPVITAKLGIKLTVIGGPPVVTASIGISGSIIDYKPRMATVSVGVRGSLVGSRPCVTLTGEIGVAASIVDSTLPTDSRTTWVSTVDTAQTECHETQPFVRGKTVQDAEYGRLTIYIRQFTIPRGNHGQAILQTILAPGAHMKNIWADEWFSLALDGPKAMPGATVRQHAPGGVATGKDAVEVTFAAIKTLDPMTAGVYNATARRLVARDAFGETWVEWGIAASMATTGVPTPGTVLKGFGGVYSPKCVHVDPNDLALPGRLLIKTTYRRRFANPFILKPVSVEDVFTASGVVSIRKRTSAKTSTGGTLGEIHF
ncbi:MAG TPA: hypothetical protein VMY42_27145 [Thermoguttaceae bacterium]|nr:hypothetical protein [Thermoguttaceae bacterium]